MRIAVDLSNLRTSGTRVYAQGFFPAIAKLLGPGDELVIFVPKNFIRMAHVPAAERVRFVENSSFRIVPLRILWQLFVLPGILKKMAAEVLFSVYDIGPAHAPCPVVLGIRNPNPITFAERTVNYSPAVRTKGYVHRWLVRAAARNAGALIFPSSYAAEKIGPLLGVTPEKCKIVYHGLDTEFWLGTGDPSQELPAPLKVSDSYVLFASKFYPQKRAELLLEAFRMWRRRYGRTEFKLVCCGEDPHSHLAAGLIRRIRSLHLENDVFIPGVVERPVLRALYRHATLFVMPTVLETFGFPYIEAMASRIPLICADIEVAREICGSAAYYFRPDDLEDLVAAMEVPFHDEVLRAQKLAQGAERAGNFSWQREAGETLACIKATARREFRENALLA